MTSDEEKPIEESNYTSRTTRFAEWLMRREEQRANRESNLEGLVKWNVLISFLTLGMVGGFETARLAIELIPYL